MKIYNVYAGKIRVMKVYAKDQEAALKEANRQIDKSNRRSQYPGEITIKQK